MLTRFFSCASHRLPPRPALLLLMGLLFQCREPNPPPPTPPPPPPAGHQFVKLETWPALVDDTDAESLDRALARQLNWLAAKPADWTCRVGPYQVARVRLTATLTRFRELWAEHHQQPQALQQALQREFDLYQWTYNDQNTILLTGYYAPIIAGRRGPDKQFRFPIYRRPDDLLTIQVDAFEPRFLQPGSALRGGSLMARLDGKRVVPYYDRAAIDGAGRLAGRGLELVYLDNYWQQFSFHVQGGGFIQLNDGSYMKLNYAGKNGRAYVSVGKLLIESGDIAREDMSMQALSAYFAANPDAVERFCYQNPSYVFYQWDGKTYRELKPDLFPHGSLGFPVTTKRSLAFDKKYFGGGMLAFVSGVIQRSDTQAEPFSRFALDQDTGGAIRENHVDVFMGAGDAALNQAGFLKDRQGAVYFLILKPQIATPAG